MKNVKSKGKVTIISINSTVIYLHASTIDYKHKIKIDDYMVLSFKKYIKTFNFNISNKILS